MNKPETPQIILNGWWWKRWFPKYRNLQRATQALMDYIAPEVEKDMVEFWKDHLLRGTTTDQWIAKKYKDTNQ